MDKLVAMLGTPLFALLCALIFAGLAAGGKTCPSLIFFERDHLLVELIDSALKVSTCIRDKDGNLIAEMIRNEWKVARPPKTWMDHGVGIFEKIMKHFNLADAREALLELSKGKLTSDPRNHSGEGIFSRPECLITSTSAQVTYSIHGNGWMRGIGSLRR
jgi:hypothetical protein